MTGAQEDPARFERQQCIYFTAALLSSKALDATALCATVRPEDIAQLDGPTATIYTVAVGLARRGADPTHTEVWAALLREGGFAGNKGDLVKDRMLAATTTVAHPARLFEIGSQLLSLVFRARLAAAGSALAAAATDMSEADAWALLVREGVATKKIYERIEKLRGEAA